jgi:hypothetical protein
MAATKKPIPIKTVPKCNLSKEIDANTNAQGDDSTSSIINGFLRWFLKQSHELRNLYWIVIMFGNLDDELALFSAFQVLPVERSQRDNDSTEHSKYGYEVRHGALPISI